MRILYLEGDPCSPKHVGATLRTTGDEVTEIVDAPYHGTPGTADVVVMSDYPASSLTDDGLRTLAGAVANGTGLLMVGGWTSLGRGGYAATPLADVLPVHLDAGDDRANRPAGAYPRPTGPHPATAGLPWDRPPVLVGYNRVREKGDADVLLEAFPVTAVGERHADLDEAGVPLLVTGGYGDGRVSVLATDLAPHWSGGWTDWGRETVTLGNGGEVGDAYTRFVTGLVAWTAGRPVPETMRRAPG